MIRGLLKILLVVVILVALGAFLLGRRSGGGAIFPDSSASANSTNDVNTSKAREVGANIGEATANAAHEAKDALETGAVTAKIKSKMALDDLVKARNIDVDTNGTVVTLTGVVGSAAERQRAVQLAKETGGVTSVVDHLRVE